MNAPNPPLRVLIVDDEAPARRRLRDVLTDCASELPVNIVGEADNGLDALDQVQRQPVDAVLLDIRMPGMDGLECAAHLNRLATPPAIIFSTAYDAYACQAFDLSAVDYLLKPVRADRLVRALSRAHRINSGALDQLREAYPRARTHLSVSEKGRIVLIPVADILYLKAELKYVTVRTALREFLLEESLTRLEEEFAGVFLRIHRNCLAAKNRIREMGKLPGEEDGHFLRLDGLDERLTVSRRQYSSLRETLKNL
ncbi:MAG: DNA-binding response regulator [Hydrogenophilales bacterium 16-64-46]|nr:MAG: DNA-binding response regulator [Hydrogenophilales bacterium 12-64-13]OYZ05351.1 MAG: DNA-binding response regulator [Hydrogenophilales bacterium 16-64-46]OZA37705.1 MAG: DNA-binding response regulator [Hydrogenophilales bacterium 17-64-34]HQS99349.1 LytTR family DNA-binding domain-containing protein [Thiobacillus sp.]